MNKSILLFIAYLLYVVLVKHHIDALDYVIFTCYFLAFAANSFVKKHTCPYCKEEIKEGAIICPHCRSVLKKENDKND
ncbi:MAG: hypothetical protein DBY32_04465 [Phascolarctobacterium sp.]|nr:MAG: hypothetical protein DBY32_04465 [Phascolarctobacterium sp.]